jgi:NAD(P)-dependent dehydrogenase (short-subunit alcohol dehydrogenase family)
VVTGAARGLGRTVAEFLTECGWDVWAVDVRPFPPGFTAGRATLADITDADAMTALFEEADAAGGVDGLVNNAAVLPLEAWDAVDASTIRRVLDVNVVGTFLCCQAAGAAMRRHGRGGSIVNVSSLTFYKGIATGVAYSASKGAVIGLTRSMARALGRHAIRVNAVAPGLMATEGVREQAELGAFSWDRLGERDDDRQLPGRTQPLGVAHAIRYLLEDQSAEITGQVLAVDGGSIFL